MAVSLDTPQLRALDLGTDDWTWLYELAFWYSDEENPTDHTPHIPTAQAVLLSLLDSGLAEIALCSKSGSYDVVDDDRARQIIRDPRSWQTAFDLNEQASDFLFAYCATETGRKAYSGSSSRGAV